MAGRSFDLDYSGHVLERFSAFERERPRLSPRFADTIDRTCSNNFWMTDDAFRNAMDDAVEAFLGEATATDIDSPAGCLVGVRLF